MKVTATLEDGRIVTLEMSEETEVFVFKITCDSELNLGGEKMSYTCRGVDLVDDAKTLGSYGISDGDLVLVQRLQRGSGVDTMDSARRPVEVESAGAPSGASHQQVPGVTGDPKVLMENILADPHELALLRERNPTLAEAVLSKDLDKFVKVLTEQQLDHITRQRELAALASADPMDPEVQRKIAEKIRQDNVNENMQTAMEWSPENFGQVHMLYIDVNVNGQAIKAFVDSGAQMTIMSQACAERCNITRLMDRRFAGIAKGVGTQRILGRVHLCDVKVSNFHFNCSFSILEDQEMDMVLGLDMLKRHQCRIDLMRNVLTIRDEDVPFLPEGELPEYARLNRPVSEEDAQIADAMHRSAEEHATSQQPRGAAAAGPSAGGASASSMGPPASKTSRTAAPSGSPTRRPIGLLGQPVTSATLGAYPPEDILKITSKGFTRQQAVEALRKANGNVDAALLSLYTQQMISQPGTQ